MSFFRCHATLHAAIDDKPPPLSYAIFHAADATYAAIAADV